ncbi:MAG: carbonate dehydratase [Chloroflexia bacterium]|nr:carbonate dehydratase [Chloroflexia bacterium]
MQARACGCDEFQWRRLLSRRHLLKTTAGAAAALAALPEGRMFGQGASPGASPAATPGASARRVVLSGDVVTNTSYISPLVELYGDIEIGQRSFIASNTILFASDGRIVSLGDENNVQDNVYLLASKGNLMFSDQVSIAHHAIIENSTVGDFTFFGFRSRTRNSEIGEGSMIMHNTDVENVSIPPNRITPMGVLISTQAEADALPELIEANDEFKHEVQEVNLEFAESYIRLYEELGRSGVESAGVNPSTSWNPDPITPQIGEATVLAELVRIVGDVRLGEESSVGQRTAIRADEGTPIVIGRRARIQSRVTFHALKGTRVDVGENARIGDGNVIHGPVSIGDNFESEDDCVVFRATVEDNVTVRSGATVAGEFTLREGTIVPEGTVVSTQEEADALPVR